MLEHFYDEEEAKQFFLQYGVSEDAPAPELTELATREAISRLLSIMQLPDFLSAFPASAYNRHVLEYLAALPWNSSSTALRMYLKQRRLLPVDYRRIGRESNIKARLLGAAGRYPNVELREGKSHYAFRAGIPMLLTEDDENARDSEVDFLNAQELKLSTAIMLSPEHRGFFIHFEEQDILRINKKAFADLPPQSIIDLAYALLLLQSRKIGSSGDAWPQNTASTAYQYATFDKDSKDFHRVFDSIDTSDQLLMRTLFFLVKSQMLWTNRCFGEDAIANVMFCLEGTLLLIQRRQGLADDKIDIRALAQIFATTFDRGEELFDFIKEGYDKRISIVHASPSEGPKWMPFLLADDFYEYYDIARMLLIYFTAGIKVDVD